MRVVKFLMLLVSLIFSSQILAEEQRSWRFKALLGDREIGEHVFTVSTDDRQTRVLSQAQFEVKFWLFKAFSYRHEAREHYDGNCLTALESDTKTGGDTYQVRAAQNGDETLQISVQSQQPSTQTLAGCHLSFAYWHPAMVERSNLINSQTGELVAVQTSLTNMTTYAGIAANEYSIKGQDLDIRVFYDRDDGNWVGLESTLENGRKLRYEPLPSPSGVTK